MDHISENINGSSEPQILAHCGRRLLQRAGGAPPAILSAAERHGWAHGRLEPWSTMGFTSCQPFLAMDTSFISFILSFITWNCHYIHIYSPIFTYWMVKSWFFMRKTIHRSTRVNILVDHHQEAIISYHKSWRVLNCQRASGMNNGHQWPGCCIPRILWEPAQERCYPQLPAVTCSLRPERSLFANVAEKTAGLRCWDQYSQVTTTLEYPRHPSCGSASVLIVRGLFQAKHVVVHCLCKHSENSLKKKTDVDWHSAHSQVRSGMS